MKKWMILSLLCCGMLGFAQMKSTTKKTTKKGTSNKSLLVKADEKAIAEAKAKAATEERAKLGKPYHPEEDAEAKINELIATAQKENKNIMIQAGGNWCIWCLRFDDYVKKTPELKKIVDENYLYYHLNYSPENKNEKVFTKYGDPGAKFGYPVFIVLDKNGNLIHTQDSSVLESGSGYGLEKVKDFFLKWIPQS